MRLLGRWVCSRVDAIRIERGSFSFPLGVNINGLRLTNDEVESLLYRDGFRDETGNLNSAAQALRFWNGRLPFEGHLIHWRRP